MGSGGDGGLWVVLVMVLLLVVIVLTDWGGRMGGGAKQGDCKGELGPVERSETGTVANVFDCKARQTKERDCL